VEHQRQYVGIDLHRHCLVIVRITDDGEILETVRVANDPLEFALAAGRAGPGSEVAPRSDLSPCHGDSKSPGRPL
jgi:hypothetical protein